jgi:hemoglobin-like flavoprotein
MLNSGFGQPLSRFRQPAPAQSLPSRKLAAMRHDLAPAHIASPDSKQFTDAFTAISVRGNGMTPAQVDLVQASYRSIEGLGPKVGELFYARLFELDPSLRSLFHTDIPEQSRKLTQMITAAVHGLHDIPALRSPVRALGARHSRYGVKPAHYGTVGAALLDTLALGLGEAFTPPAREAWTACYTFIAMQMQEGAADVVESSVATA